MKTISKITLTLSFILFGFVLSFGQNSPPKLNLDEVTISEKQNSKTSTIGCFKHFSLKTHQYSFKNFEEISIFLTQDNSHNLIEEVFVELYYEHQDSLPPLIIKLQKPSQENEPGEIIYQQKIDVQQYIKNNTLAIKIADQNIYLPQEGVFLSLYVEEKEERKHIWLKMTTRHKESFTYERIVGSDKWNKTSAFYFKRSPKFSTHSWNGSVGLRLRNVNKKP